MAEKAFTVSSDELTSTNNNLPFSNSLMSDNKDSVWLIFLDRSQLVMTIVGLVANVGTSVTLIKNGQVSMTINKFRNFCNAKVLWKLS